jgi:hypothetical protein
MRKRLLLTLAALLVPAVSFSECVLLPARYRAEPAAFVFSGTVETVAVNVASEWPSTIVTFGVDRVWKGSVAKQFVVYSFTRTPEGFDFKTGKRYLVFAHVQTDREQDDLKLAVTSWPVPIVGQCGDGTVEMERVSPPELAELGSGTVPSRLTTDKIR